MRYILSFFLLLSVFTTMFGQVKRNPKYQVSEPVLYVLDLTGWRAPLDAHGVRISSHYGPRCVKALGDKGQSMHYGVDLACHTGNKVMAIADGMVTRVAYEEKGYGNWIEIRHADGVTSRYAHLSKTNIKKGQHVDAGQYIGLSGNTGRSTGPHLHFEIRLGGIPVDPEQFFSFRVAEARTSHESVYITTGDRIMYADLSEDYHTVVKGETLHGIAKMYGTSVSRLQAYNEGSASIQDGQVIRVR